MEDPAMFDLDVLSKSVVELDKEKVMRIVAHALRMQVPVQKIIDAAILGMDEVGHLYENRKYYISDLVVSGLLFDSILEVDGIKENLCQDASESGLSMSGTILSGTVADDIHSIGKTIFRSMAMSVGFRVIDLGVDVPAQVFLEAAKEHKPDIIAISALLSTGEDNIRYASKVLKEDPEVAGIYLLLGGSCASLGTLSFPLMDGCAVTAKESVDLCVAAMQKANG